MFRTIICTLSFLSALYAGPSYAERVPQRMGNDVRVRTVMYSPSDVVRVDTNRLINTAIELGPGERINQVLLGDSEAYDVEVLSSRNIISVKPKIAGARTNMNIYTNQRVLAFWLTEGRTKVPTYRVVMRYPVEPQKKNTGPSYTFRDLGYLYSGKTDFTPVMVWNDGKNTFFQFSGDKRPSIFGVDAKGFEKTTNSAQRDYIVKVTGISESYSLRIGDEVVCIRHKAGGRTYEEELVERLKTAEF